MQEYFTLQRVQGNPSEVNFHLLEYKVKDGKKNPRKYLDSAGGHQTVIKEREIKVNNFYQTIKLYATTFSKNLNIYLIFPVN